MNIITYTYTLDKDNEYTFDIDLDRVYPVVEKNSEKHSSWTELKNSKCSNCPLKAETYRYCPVALDIENIAKRFSDILSVRLVDVRINTKNRSYFKRSDAQDALRSLFGLIMASSACPILSRLKPMALFHIPLASIEETVHHLLGTYLIKQYLVYRKGEEKPDWDLDGVAKLYSELKIVNTCFLNRLRGASHEDASLNAMLIFVSLTNIVLKWIDDILDEIAPGIINGF